MSGPRYARAATVRLALQAIVDRRADGDARARPGTENHRAWQRRVATITAVLAHAAAGKGAEQ